MVSVPRLPISIPQKPLNKIVLKKAGFILQADIFEHRHCEACIRTETILVHLAEATLSFNH